MVHHFTVKKDDFRYPEQEQLQWEPLGLTEFCLLQEGNTLISKIKHDEEERLYKSIEKDHKQIKRLGILMPANR